MRKLAFVIGAVATGKTYFVEHNFSKEEYELLNVYDYQQKAYDETGFGDFMPFDVQFKCLYKANEMLLKDIVSKLSEGKNVVVEHTLYKAKRRITYIDEIRKALDVTIAFYVMKPSNSRWKENIQKRKLRGKFENYKGDATNIEFPNVAEGINEIYEVTDNAISLRMETAKPELVDKARAELKDEYERLQREENEENKHRELIESMNTRPFWHYCEICGKKEYLTAQKAYDEGWTYPPTVGCFGLLSQRTCGDCEMEDSLYMKVMKQDIQIVFEKTLTPEELITWKRIQSEPESLL